MMKLMERAVSALCLMLWLWGVAACASPLERPNRGKELYAGPWSEEFVALATTCDDLDDAECTTLRRLAVMPHAYWVGFHMSPDRDFQDELQDLHNMIRDALRENRVPTIVLYMLPDRDCGGGVRPPKRVTTADYELWVAKLADAVTYYKGMAINIIIEPGWLSHVIAKMGTLCNKRTNKELLEERIELIRYVLWNLVMQDKQRNRLNPNLRLFVDVGGPGSITGPRTMLATAKALEEVLKVAVADGISVNVGGRATFEESRAWAKELLRLMRGRAKEYLTIAIDISRSGNKVDEGCNVSGAALDERAPTLSDPDPQIELALIIQDPSTSDGDGAKCNGGRPAGAFDLHVFREYLRNTAKKRVGTDP